MCSSCACAARIVAMRSSNGLLNSSVGPQSGWALAKRVRTARARRRRAPGSSRPRDARRAIGALDARDTATPFRPPPARRNPADGAGAIRLEVQPLIAVVYLDEKDRAVG